MSKKENTNNASGGFFTKKVFSPDKAGGLTVRIVLALLIPYAYLFLCGFIFDKLLHRYDMVMFIFISLCVFYLIALCYIVICIVNFSRNKKRNA